MLFIEGSDSPIGLYWMAIMAFKEYYLGECVVGVGNSPEAICFIHCLEAEALSILRNEQH